METESSSMGEIELSCSRPVEVLPEGIHLHQWGEAKTTKFSKGLTDLLKDETFAFLVVGHWIGGEAGHDRKDIFSTLNVFLQTFNGKENKPCLLLKTGTTFSKKEHVEYMEKIGLIMSSVQDNILANGGKVDLPKIYLIHGDFTRDEMNSLYYHPKVKAMVSFTKGEAFGRPLLEFSFTGKPIIASSWSGHMDFLPTNMAAGLLPGQLHNVHPSVVWPDVIIPEGKWFYVDYKMAANKLLDVWYNYNAYKQTSTALAQNNKNKFSFSATLRQFDEILCKHLVPFINGKSNSTPITNVPKLKKIDEELNPQSIEEILGLTNEENKNG
jgi:glycosyltransferase involved in cell wall biosynthesis